MKISTKFKYYSCVGKVKPKRIQKKGAKKE